MSNQNIFNNFKSTLLSVTDGAITSFNRVSPIAMPLISESSESQNSTESQNNTVTESQTNTIPEPQELKLQLNNFEKKLENKYKGCYLDDPTSLTMSEYLGIVNNQLECINKGTQHKLNYVGIQQGNLCYGSDTLPKTQLADRNINCNQACLEADTGNCGGFYYNQVYQSSENSSKNSPVNIIDTFNNMNDELQNINSNIRENYFRCSEPIDSYKLCILLIFIILMIYFIIEYIKKK